MARHLFKNALELKKAVTQAVAEATASDNPNTRK